jgi:hypothetical protein
VGFTQFFEKGINNKYDINSDGIVDSTDFSIFLYYTKINSVQVLSVSTHGSSIGSTLGISEKVNTKDVEFNRVIAHNNLMDVFTKLLLLEGIMGIPFFMVFALLAFQKRKTI